MKKKIIITTGGTGGHIYPALAVGKKLLDKGNDVLFVGSKTRMEKKLVPEEGMRFIGIDIYPFKNLKKIFSNLKGFFQALNIVRREKPDVIIGFGNYVSIPVLVAGAMFRKKIYLQEQNANLGMANKMFSKIAIKCFLAFDNTYEEISDKDKHRFMVTGNPLREDIYSMDKEKERERLKISKDEKVLLITGGSLGAKSLNEAVLFHLKDIYKDKNLRLYWAIGEANFDEINEKLKDQPIKISNIIKPYFNNMVNIMAAADLVVCRAGALTVSEIIQLEKPSILVPYNSIKVGQYQNAEILAEKEATILYNDGQAEEAFERALELLKNNEELSKMSRKVRNFKKNNAADTIIESLDIWRN